MTDRMLYGQMADRMLGFISGECQRLTAILIATSMT
jgi:hypothetical protein